MEERAEKPIFDTRETVLVVDEDRGIRTLVATWLEAHGYRSLTAATTAHGRELLQRGGVGLCLCGYEFAPDVAKLAPDVALVIMSASGDVVVADQALTLGASGYLLKPFRANELEVAVRNALLRRQLEQEARELRERLEQAVEQRAVEVAVSREETIQRLARAIEFRDTTTGRHVERMSEFCRMLADRIGISSDRAALIRTASLLHDVGKLAIPDRILSKPGGLEDEEWAEMKRHTTIGHQLLSGSSSELVELAAAIALTHHERVDGLGYPNGLRGDEIPVEGRIAAICDVFDALTSSRPYRQRAFSVDDAFSIMRAKRGDAFDREILDFFFNSRDEVKEIRARYADNGNVLTAA